jgi:hypothetical protein
MGGMNLLVYRVSLGTARELLRFVVARQPVEERVPQAAHYRRSA